MRQIDIILLAMKNDVSKKSYAKLESVLEDVLLPSHCDKSDEAVIAAYQEYFRFSNHSEQTIKMNYYTYRDLSRFCEKNLVDYTHTDIKNYLDSCKSTCKPRSIARKLSIIRAFYDFMVLEEWITINPCNKVPKIKIPLEHKNGISDVELAQVMKHVDNDRDLAIIEFMKATGCRVSEVSKLNYGDINFKDRTAFIRQAKGQKDRVVSFDARCEKYLKIYLRPFGPRDPEDPMFLARSKHIREYLYLDKRLATSSIKVIFHKYSKISGVDSFHAHALRHYCITKLLQKKMPLKMVAMQAGHASTSTTLDVYDDVALEEMQLEYKKAMG